MDVRLEDGFTRLALPLQMAWLRAGFSGVALAVVHALAIECWAFGRQGYVARVGPAQLAERLGASKRQVNDALRVLAGAGFVARVPGGLQLIPRVPPALQDGVAAWYRQVAGRNPPDLGGNPPGVGGNPPGVGGNPPGVGGNPPDLGGNPPGAYRVRAREDKINQNSSSSLNSPQKTDDDDVSRHNLTRLRLLLPELARLIAAQTRDNRELTLERLLSVRAAPEQLCRAAAALIVAIRDQGFRVKSNPAGLLAHALKHPEAYPPDPGHTPAPADPAPLLSAADIRRLRPGTGS